MFGIERKEDISEIDWKPTKDQRSPASDSVEIPWTEEILF